MGFAEPCLFLSVVFLLRASLQKTESGPLSKNWNFKTAIYVLLCSFPMFALQMTVVLVGPHYKTDLHTNKYGYFFKFTSDYQNDAARCYYPLMSTIFLGVFANVLTLYIFWLGRRILSLVISKGLQKRVPVLIIIGVQILFVKLRSMRITNGRIMVRWDYIMEQHIRATPKGSKLVQPTITYSFRRPPRGGVEQMQTDELTTLMQNVSLTPMQDRWTWTLNASGDFSVASVRNLIDTTMLPKGEYQTRWIRVVPIKVNTFAWKVMTNSLPTRFNISRRGIDIDSISCGNCDLGVETSNHLFFTCDMAKQITRLIMRWWDVPELEIDSYTDWRNWIVNVRMPSKNKDMFEGVFYVMWWTLWIFRNNKIFGDKIPSKAMLFDDVICKSFHWCRARSKMLFSWNDWLKNPFLISM
ncbi:RNA-directed DNA polymerase, eukaryota [Tanacetum coccineum]